MKSDKIIARLARESLMLHVYRERSARRTPADLLAQYARSAMLQPSAVDGRRLRELEEIAFAAARAFEAVELAPAAPLGVNRVLGEIDQNSCLATVRLAEVLADPTTVKALECARRRRAGATGTIRLCARSRPLRLQPIGNTPGFSPHFGLFSLVSAGRHRGALGFELESLREHLGVYLTALGAIRAAGYRLGPVAIAVSDTERDARRLDRLPRELFEPLAREFAGGTVIPGDRSPARARHPLLSRPVLQHRLQRRRRAAREPGRRRLHRLDAAAALRRQGAPAGERRGPRDRAQAIRAR